MMFCNSTAATTGTKPTSTLDWARDHSHPPNPARIGAKFICQDSKQRCVLEPTATPHIISTDALIGIPDDVNLALPQTSSLKRTLQRKRRALSIDADPNVAAANDRSLFDLYIPESLYRQHA